MCKRKFGTHLPTCRLWVLLAGKKEGENSEYGKENERGNGMKSHGPLRWLVVHKGTCAHETGVSKLAHKMSTLDSFVETQW
jgi:hypothetical protein